MAVKILIKRRVPGSIAKSLIPLFRELRVLATSQPGYISGETLINANNPMEVMVVSNWENIESWVGWKKSDGRATIDAQLEALQGKPTEYEPFVLSKYWLTVKEEGWKKRQEGVW